MKQLKLNDKLPKDYWGNHFVWVPFGKAGVVQGPNGDYEVSLESILRQESIDTLANTPVYVNHPKETVVTPDNHNLTEPVGHCCSYWRTSEDGLGAEVLVKLNNRETYQQILDDVLVESSPTYVVEDGVRIFNHLAILKKGFARGGSKMRILVEGKEVDSEDEDLPLETTGKPLIVAEGYFEGDRLANDVDPVLQTIQRAKDIEIYTEFKKMKNEEKNEVVETTFDGKELTEGFNNLKVLVEGLIESLKPEPVQEPDPQDLEKAIYKEGFEAGLIAGEVLVFAEGHGYVKSEVDVAEQVVLAQKHLIAKAFPNLKAESIDSVIDGVYIAAVSQLKSAKPEPVETKEPEVKTEGRTDTPTINVNSTVAKPAGRLKLK